MINKPASTTNLLLEDVKLHNQTCIKNLESVDQKKFVFYISEILNKRSFSTEYKKELFVFDELNIWKNKSWSPEYQGCFSKLGKEISSKKNSYSVLKKIGEGS